LLAFEPAERQAVGAVVEHVERELGGSIVRAALSGNASPRAGAVVEDPPARGLDLTEVIRPLVRGLEILVELEAAG
jgi:hypothetical protein